MRRSSLLVSAIVFGLLGCAAPNGSMGDRVVRIYPLQEPIDRRAGGQVEVISATWSEGMDVRAVVREEIEGALRRAGVFSVVGSGAETGRYLVRVEMNRRNRAGRSGDAVDGVVSVVDRQRNLVTATFRVRPPAQSEDARTVARDLGQRVAGVLLEPVKSP